MALPDGTASANVSGGTAPFNYTWSNGSTMSTISGLNPGLYIVTVTDVNNCSALASDTVFLGAGLNVDIDAPVYVCPGEFETATVIAQGGTPNYTYLWSNGQISQTAVDLGPGIYSVTATDPTGCSGNASVTLMQGGGFSVNYTFENVVCFGAATGSIELDVSNGLPPYSYLWSNGDTIALTDSLTMGNYTVTIADSTECSIVQSIDILEPPLLEIDPGRLQMEPAANLGAASAVASGGTFPYQYLWNNGDTLPVIVLLDSATYQITITDGNDCVITDSVAVDVIDQPGCFVELTQPIFGYQWR